MSKHVYERVKIIYVGYVGIQEACTSHCMYKYGITKNLQQRFLQHRKAFPTFQPRLVYPTLYHDIVEQLFTKQLRDLGLHRTYAFDNRHHRELFVTTPEFTLLDAHVMLQKLIQKAEQEYPIFMTK